MVYLSEWINRWAHANWQSFATQDYFDRRGVFMACLWSGPLLLNGFVGVLCFIVEAASTLIAVKRAQFRRKMSENATTQQKANMNNMQTTEKKGKRS
mmetsp:Transcript_11224/g.28319  ORF Transcript_11224/g.28319 Transcript_11224/m.28319 type:complete len:97 (-) Transcript_11224:31-321(-)